MHTAPDTRRPIGAVCRMFGVHRTTVARWTKDGVLPPPIKINGRNYWREADLRALADGRQMVEQERAA
jgi:DNA-binding transcriptional MerR regulator